MMHFILYFNTEFFYRFKYLSLVMILCFLSIKLFLYIHPPSLSYFIWLPWQWYIRHTQRRACFCFLCLSEYGDSASEKHPLLHFLTKPSQCHQQQDHEGHQQIPANPNPHSQQSQDHFTVHFSVLFTHFQCAFHPFSVISITKDHLPSMVTLCFITWNRSSPWETLV